MKKLLAIVMLFAGEGVAIYSEIIAAKNINNFQSTFWKMSGLMAFAGLLLIGGYMLGMKYIQNIWIVGAVSIASIVVLEPIITYAFFHTLPSRGALIGLVLAVIAIICALFVK